MMTIVTHVHLREGAGSRQNVEGVGASEDRTGSTCTKAGPASSTAGTAQTSAAQTTLDSLHLLTA